MASKEYKPVEDLENAYKLGRTLITRFHSPTIFGSVDEFNTSVAFCSTAAFLETGGPVSTFRAFANAINRNWCKELKAHGFYRRQYQINGKKYAEGWKKLPVFSFSQIDEISLFEAVLV